MTVVAIGSLKASPGVSTTALLLAQLWSMDRQVMVVECDPAGGDFAARFKMKPEPGLVTLAAAGRHGLSGDDVIKHAISFPNVEVVLAPSGAAAARSAIQALEPHLVPALRSLNHDVFIDCGRLDPGSPSEAFTSEADLTVLVLRPVVAEIARVSAASEYLISKARAAALVLVGKATMSEPALYPTREVQSVVRLPVAGTLASDRPTAAVLMDPDRGVKTLETTPLVRSARDVAHRVRALVEVREASVADEEAS